MSSGSYALVKLFVVFVLNIYKSLTQWHPSECINITHTLLGVINKYNKEYLKINNYIFLLNILP